ncbi:glycoside hydrolase family 18 protein [Actinosynnema sp. NPDC047251]|uniref:chitinase n=1 Tax=Saccharothrix espanaensis (strain ATCC 51144 / DSM 44229 / JCM 9112 / NBRC 15066 / NRRL 15764) TaxID=1179773 RepID=K0K990_SACES|nr:glycoside hydrolase family 18 protein [Saccharothrix espanaensis]CCH34931.1 Chitinase [Saccharothrix espanaensis DSM 44229]
MSSRRWVLPALLASALAVSLAPQVAQAHGDRHQPRTVGYFTNWSGYDRNFLVKNLVTSGTAAKLTHLNYAFGFLDAGGKCVSSDPWADYGRSFGADQSVNGKADEAGQPLLGNFNQLKQLKAKYPKLKVYISLGGWSGSKYFSDAALTAESRAAHVKSCVDLWLKGNLAGAAPGAAAGLFDGIDLDWEWPSSEANPGNVIRPEDKDNFTALLKEYRKQFSQLSWRTGKHYDLTAFLPANPGMIDRGFDVPKVFSLLTFGTTQGYDYHGSWDPLTNQQSALRTPAGDPTGTNFSTQVVIDHYLKKGAPRDKIVMGVPFFSRGWTGVRNENNGLFQPATGAAPGTFEAGYEDYRTLKKQLDKFKVHRDPKAGHAWLFDGTTFWTWDDPTELKRKGRYVVDRRLGGAMIWSLDSDTADGELIRALKSGLS